MFSLETVKLTVAQTQTNTTNGRLMLDKYRASKNNDLKINIETVFSGYVMCLKFVCLCQSNQSSEYGIWSPSKTD